MYSKSKLPEDISAVVIITICIELLIVCVVIVIMDLKDTTRGNHVKVHIRKISRSKTIVDFISSTVIYIFHLLKIDFDWKESTRMMIEIEIKHRRKP
jgi:hypothetical protein